MTATNGNASAVAAGGNITGEVNGGNSALAFAMGNITDSVTGVNDAVAYSFGNQSGNVSTSFGNVSVVTAGLMSGTVTAGRDAVVSAFNNITGRHDQTTGLERKNEPAGKTMLAFIDVSGIFLAK